MSKQRITITLSQSTLNKIDQLIDKKQVRSRSHAIETILQKQLKPAVDTAVILAGGKSENAETIKPLIEYQNQPLIFHIIDHLLTQQVSKIIILAHSQAQGIKTKIQQRHPNLNVKYIFEDKPLGTAGALKNAQRWLKSNFFCLHGDIYTDINLQELAIFHEQQNSLATIAVKPRMSHHSFDNISVQGSQITAFEPKNKEPQPSLVNSGVYLFSPKIFNYMPDKTPAMLEKDVFPQLVNSNQLHAFTFEGIWLDITTEQQYQQDLHN